MTQRPGNPTESGELKAQSWARSDGAGDKEDPDTGLGEGSSREGPLQEALDRVGLEESLLQSHMELDSAPRSAILKATFCPLFIRWGPVLYLTMSP